RVSLAAQPDERDGRMRSRRVVSGDLVWYEIACRFKRPVAFPGLVADVRRRENSKARLVHLNGSPRVASAKTG
ncbi:MAG: hypothetical protein ABW292_22240, partial [Vicinamibacterales bacterium]